MAESSKTDAGAAVLEAVLTGGDDAAEIAVADFAEDQGQHHSGEAAAIVAGGDGQLGQV